MSKDFFEIEFIEENKVLIKVSGHLGMEYENEFRILLDDMIEKGKTCIIVDFENTGFLCSPSIGSLAVSVKKLRPVKGIVVLINVNPYLMEVFEMTGLKGILLFCNSLEEALKL